MNTDWINCFPWELGSPCEIIGETSKPIFNKFDSGVSIKRSQFIDIEQTIKIESYPKNCLIDRTFFERCFSIEQGGAISIEFIDSGSIIVSRCYVWKCYSIKWVHFLNMSLDERNISSAKIFMTSLNECGKSEVTHMMRMQWGHVEMSNLNNTWCLSKSHCAPCTVNANSEIKYLNIASNTAKAIILFSSGMCHLSKSNIINNTEKVESIRDDFNGTICFNAPDTIVRVLSCYIRSGNSFLSCSRAGRIVFVQCSLDHKRVKYDSTILFENNMNSVEMTLFGTYGMRAKIPYIDEKCSLETKNLVRFSVLCFFAGIVIIWLS